MQKILENKELKIFYMDVPTHLDHKPIIGIRDYDRIEREDRIYESSDAMALSIGQAQYRESELSAKVFRHTGETWSRQSEELPMHRVLDLTRLFLLSILRDSNVESGLNRDVQVLWEERVNEINDYYRENEEFLRPRLEEIRNMLNQIL